MEKIKSKNQCYQIAKKFIDLDDNRLSIVLNSNQELEITPDITEKDKVLYKYDNEYLKKQNLADYLYKKIEKLS